MRFNNRTEYIQSEASEKLTLVHVHGKQRLYVFSGPSSFIYSKTVPYFVNRVKQNDTYLTRVTSLPSLTVAGQFYYDIKSSILYIRPDLDAAPNETEIIVEYRFFYSDVGINATWDLNDISEEVFYDGRIKSAPGYKHKIGIDQALTSLVGSGTLNLHASDGELDSIFDKIIFENQQVVIYSWNRDLDPSEARVIYRGRITNKSFNTDDISFTIKDPIFELLEPPSNSVYSSADNVNSSVNGQYKRSVYGRVDGLRCQSVDQIADGYALTGTISADSALPKLFGTGTQFLTEVFQDDEIKVGTQTFTVERILSNTEIDVSDEPDFSFVTQPGTNKPERGFSNKNRSFLSTEHICTEQTKTIVSVPQLNRVVLSDTDGLFPGDFIEFQSTSERIEIKNTAPGNIVVLRQNMINRPTIGSNAIRRPIQRVYINGRLIPANKYTVNNSSSCGVTLATDVEFSIAKIKTANFNLNFTNGNREITYTDGGEISLEDTFQAGDWIKPEDVTYTTYYKISYVDENSIWLTQNFSNPTITDVAKYKKPEYVDDDTVISVDILGKTVNGLASGVWISTVAQTERDLLSQLAITSINEASFTNGAVDGNQLVSIAIPEDFSSKSLPSVKDIVDKLNKSISSSLTLDNDLNIKFQVLNAFTEEDIQIITDFDVIDWNIKSVNGKAFNKAVAKYRFTDVNNGTLTNGNQVYTFESEFVNRYIETGKVSEIELYLYNQNEAQISAHRNIYQNRLSMATVTIKSDLRLENTEIGDIVIVDFARMYKRYGDEETRKKVMLVIGKTVTGEGTEFELSDLGNTFNTSSYITDNLANEYILSDENERLINGYITDNQGIVEDLEDTAGVHLIS
jgi:hypothetical protein